MASQPSGRSSTAAAGCFGGETVAKVVNDLVVELLAALRPSARADHLFDAATQAVEAHDLRCGFEMVAQFGAQHLKEHQFADPLAADGERTQIAVDDLPHRFAPRAENVQSEAAQDFGERFRKFTDGHHGALEFGAKIMEHGLRGVLYGQLIDVAYGIAEQFEGDLLGGAGDVFTGRRFENQAIGA